MPGPALYGKRAAKARPRAGYARPYNAMMGHTYVRKQKILR